MLSGLDLGSVFFHMTYCCVQYNIQMTVRQEGTAPVRPYQTSDISRMIILVQYEYAMIIMMMPYRCAVTVPLLDVAHRQSHLLLSVAPAGTAPLLLRWGQQRGPH